MTRAQKADSHDQFENGMQVLRNQRIGALAELEQRMWRSGKTGECAACGDPATVFRPSILIASVARYGLCAECAA